MGNIEIVIAGMGRQKIIIGGDFNARARGWDKICNERGYILEEWATDREMIIMNEGRKSTCIRAQGSSVVDITMGTETAVRGVSSWEVDEYTETLSDHRYIKIDVKESKDENLYRKRIFPKWNIKRLEEDWFNTSVSCGEWLNRQRITDLIENGEIEKAERIFKRVITDACNNSMKKEKGGNKKIKVYWWSKEIADIRERCNMWRRRLVRAKGRQDRELEVQLAGELKNNRKELKKAIGKANKIAWDELLEGLSGDPWGQPYKVVMGKIKPENVNIGEKLPSSKMHEILNRLFPRDRKLNVYRDGGYETDERIPAVTDTEMNEINKRAIRKGARAPGPDGIQARLIVEAQRCAEDGYRGLYDGCLKTGIFPNKWKVAKIVLLKKEGKPDGETASYRPLCLLNEQGKMLEIIKKRLEEYMRESGKGLSKNQYGFIAGRPTTDAIMRIKQLIEEKQGKGQEVVAVSLDIKNAFNSIEWGEINNVLKREKYPEYLRKIINNYLSNREIVWVGEDKKKHKMKVDRGVPQRSVLGPLLWNITYDSVLKMPTPANCDVVCYADDTLILAGGDDTEKALNKANILINAIARRINWMSLQVAAEKTEALKFRKRGERRSK